MQLNSFNQSPVKGQADLKLNLNVLSAKFVDASDNKAKNGDVVVLDAGDKVPTFKLATENTANKLYGIVLYNLKTNEYSNNNMISVALSGSCVYLEAGKELTGGSYVYYDFTTKKITDVAGEDDVNLPLGFVVNSVAEDQLVRVILK